MPKVNNTAELLCEAANVLSDHDWTQHSYARDAMGIAVTSNDPEACSFCMLGALERARQKAASDFLLLDDAIFVLNQMAEGQGADNIARWNDLRCQNKAEAIDMLHAAATAAALKTFD